MRLTSIILALCFSSTAFASSQSDCEQGPCRLSGNRSAKDIRVSCRNLRLQGNHILKANCRNVHHRWVSTSIDLDQFIKNQNGQLIWGRGNFSKGAERVELQPPAILKARLLDGHGRFSTSTLNLAKRIVNINGKLKYRDH